MTKARRILETYLTNIGQDQSELHVGDLHILMSFKSPVAFYRDGENSVCVLSDASIGSKSKEHISSWVKGRTTHSVGQSEIQHVMMVATLAGVA